MRITFSLRRLCNWSTFDPKLDITIALSDLNILHFSTIQIVVQFGAVLLTTHNLSYLDFKTASTIATSIVHSKLDYCNSLYYNLPQSQKKKPQNIQNSLARAVIRTPKSSHITLVLKSSHWLKIDERTKYKLLSLSYKVLTTHQPQYLHDVISVQPYHNTRSSSMVTLAPPPTRSSLKITNRSFRYAAPCLWNELPTDLREPRQTQETITHSSSSSSPSSLSLLASSLTRSVFHS